MAETGDLKSLQCGFESRHRHAPSFRRMKNARPFLAGFFLLLASAAAARAWDYTGHMLVDQIAYEQVSPRVREAVARLVAPLENSYNDHKPYHFVTAGAWLDDMRSQPNYPWGKLHYVDVPYTPSGSSFSEPPPPHLLSGMDEALAVLRAPDASGAKKSEALAMLMHFVGDVHQPMHCVDWEDRGGNQFFIAGVPFSDLGKKAVPNLHAFWDKAFRFDVENGSVIERYHAPWPNQRPESPESGLIHDEAAKISAQFPRAALPQLAAKTPRDWARESHLIACLFAYPAQPHPTNAEVVTLPPEYVHRAHEIACERVALAGCRLADLLEDLFGKP